MVNLCFVLAMDLRKTDGASVHSKSLAAECRAAGIAVESVSFDSLGSSGVAFALRAPFAVPDGEHVAYLRSPLAFLSIPLLKMRGKKVVLGVAALKHLESPAWMRQFVKLAEDAAIRWSDGVMTISPGLEKYCRSRGAKKVLVYLPPVDFSAMQKAKPAAKREAFTIGYVGGKQEWQGLGLLRDALARASGDFKVRVYGDATAADFGNNPRVKIMGRVANSSVPSVMKSFDLFVLPRPRHPSAETATPIKLVEAMACGVPCLVTDVGGATWFVKRGRDAIVCGASAAGIASGIAWALRNRKKLPAIGGNGRLRVGAELRGTGGKIRRLLSSLD
ncbi:Glycosyl transferases group 1 [Candidatus Norongarragalina meridionalis]|nr:Glycosyl transferases group 1 [Candidatus Norongarragalina meridionalis]